MKAILNDTCSANYYVAETGEYAKNIAVLNHTVLVKSTIIGRISYISIQSMASEGLGFEAQHLKGRLGYVYSFSNLSLSHHLKYTSKSRWFLPINTIDVHAKVIYRDVLQDQEILSKNRPSHIKEYQLHPLVQIFTVLIVHHIFTLAQNMFECRLLKLEVLRALRHGILLPIKHDEKSHKTLQSNNHSWMPHIT